MRKLGYSVDLSDDPKQVYFAAIDGPSSSIKAQHLLTFWETSKLRPQDCDYLARQKTRTIVVTCKFTADVFKKHGFKTRLIQLASEHKPQPLPRFDTFNFYSIYQDAGYWERKRPQDVVDAFRIAFPSEADVRLVMKSGPHCVVLKHFDTRIRQLREFENDVTHYHKDNHVFVSACGAEGWGYPHHDAMAFGRLVICPRIGGPLEFLDESCAWLVPFKLVKSPAGFYENHGQIGNINIPALAAAMRYAYDNRAEVMEKSTAAFVRARNFTLDQMTVSVKKAFDL